MQMPGVLPRLLAPPLMTQTRLALNKVNQPPPISLLIKGKLLVGCAISDLSPSGGISATVTVLVD
jgi:hypothetical protein